MRPEFAAAVDPVFQGAIEFLDRIEHGSADSAEIEHAKILGLFDRADTVLGASRQWQLARYALAVWIDEMLLTLPWTGSTWWRNHILEMKLFQSRICNERFFELAKQASALSCRDALEVFYNCVLLGFRGMYALAEAERTVEHNEDWPRTIDQWLDRTSRMIDVVPIQANADGTHRPIPGAPPLTGRHQVVWWSVGALCLALINVALYQFLHAHE
ncbi:MAG: DotU family type IV/VI secretion system protein [Pirellula sp.]